MRGISLWQPFATALFTPHPFIAGRKMKTHETRSRPFPRALKGERVFFHAAKRPVGPRDLTPMMDQALTAAHNGVWIDALPYGAIIGSGILREAFETTLQQPADDLDRAFGDWTPGRWAWLIEDARLLPTPIPWKANQGWMSYRYPWEAA